MLSTPDVDELTEVMDVLAGWQHDGATVPLHPGDLGWNYRFGAAATAAAVRTWSRDGAILAVGMMDSPELVRLAVSPAAAPDLELAREMVADLTRPERGLLPAGEAFVEARFEGPLRALLGEAGWLRDAPWTPLGRDLAEPVSASGLRIAVVGPALAEVRAAVQRAAFEGSAFSAERWRAMAAGPRYGEARCLVGYDDANAAVAVATVWSAGPGRPGLLEPVGVHRDHRGHGHGRAITLAAAAALAELGASSAIVCTPSSNLAAVATYASAGFRAWPEVCDLRRGA
jgi:GNAT superfamily N-acetyltransferase